MHYIISITNYFISSLVQLFFNGSPESVDKVKKFNTLISYFAFIE